MRHNGKHLEKIPPGSARAGREPAVASRAGDTEMALLMSGAIAPRWGCFGNGTTVDTAPVGRAGAAGRTETAERPATVRRRNGAEIHRNAGWNPSGAAGGRWWGGGRSPAPAAALPCSPAPRPPPAWLRAPRRGRARCAPSPGRAGPRRLPRPAGTPVAVRYRCWSTSDLPAVLLGAGPTGIVRATTVRGPPSPRCWSRPRGPRVLGVRRPELSSVATGRTRKACASPRDGVRAAEVVVGPRRTRAPPMSSCELPGR